MILSEKDMKSYGCLSKNIICKFFETSNFDPLIMLEKNKAHEQN